MAFFTVFSYATNFFNIFFYGQLADNDPTVVMHYPRKYLDGLDLHSLKILFKRLAMAWICRANRLCNLLHRLQTQIDNVVDGINRAKPILISAV
jgi:hypothetical protein